MYIKPIPYTGTFPAVPPRAVYRGHHGNHRNGLYAAMLKAAADPTSELYHRSDADGVLYRRGGASHRNGFWKGFDNDSSLGGHPTSDYAVCWRAGRDFAKAVAKAAK